MNRRHILSLTASSVTIGLAGCSAGANTDARERYEEGLTMYKQGKKVEQQGGEYFQNDQKEKAREQYNEAAGLYSGAASKFSEAEIAAESGRAKEYANDARAKAEAKTAAMNHHAEGEKQEALMDDRNVQEYRLVSIEDFKQATGPF